MTVCQVMTDPLAVNLQKCGIFCKVWQVSAWQGCLMYITVRAPCMCVALMSSGL
jgi:hypothetical protein